MTSKKYVCVLLCFFYVSSVVSAQKRYVSITFDDIPATIANEEEKQYVTDSLVAIFKRYNLPVIGFVNESKLYEDGQLVDSRVQMLRDWLDAGADIGNHTYSHIVINSATIEEYKADIKKGEPVTRSLLDERGKELIYFRHTQLRTGPTEEYRKQLNAFLKEEGYTTAPVTIDNDEYIYAFCYARAFRLGDEELMEEIKKDYLEYMENIFEFYERQSLEFLGYEPKQTLLLHANVLNADTLGELLNMMERRGYSFISLGEALEDEAYQMPEIQSERGLSWLHRWMWAAGEEPENHPAVSEPIMQLFRSYRN